MSVEEFADLVEVSHRVASGLEGFVEASLADLGQGKHVERPGLHRPVARRTVELVLPDLSFTLTTDRGVFAGTQVDAGTKLLLLTAPAPPERCAITSRARSGPCRSRTRPC